MRLGQVTLTPGVVAVLLLTAVVVSVTDLRSRRIYNVVTFPMIGLGLALNALPGGWRLAAGDWRVGAAGFGVGLGLMYVPFVLNLLKAGDVKYLAGVGALGGPWVALFTFLYGSLAHGVLCLAVLLRRGEVRPAFGNIGHYFANSALTLKPADFAARTQGQVPYALSLAVGLAAALAFGLRTGNVFPAWA
jgi:prepilin peptidase CpaA